VTLAPRGAFLAHTLPSRGVVAFGDNPLMTIVRCMVDCRASLEQAERLWYDTERWPAFVEGFGELVHVDPSWPSTGSVVEWQSTPAGRGRVRERMLEHDPCQVGVSEVGDERLTATRRVTFSQPQEAEAEEFVTVTVDLDYRLRGSSLLAFLIDRLFVRRAVRESLQRELGSFADELAVD
jgi:hypothetical protein